MNPMIYLIVNVNFRNSLKELFNQIPQQRSASKQGNPMPPVNTAPPKQTATIDQKQQQVCCDQSMVRL